MESKLTSNGNVKRGYPYSRPNHISLNSNLNTPESKKMKYNEWPMKHNYNDMVAIDTQRQSLPVYNVRHELLKHIHQVDTLIVIGETGCGKTTQIPQYIYEDGLHGNGMIGITQPRRVAATTLCSRVAVEAKTTVGDLVGYSIRFEDVTSNHTKIKFLTDGMLLREAMLDDKLMAYSVIVLDEAHERTLHTDVLFGIVKNAQAVRRRERLKFLKILVMSATMDVDHFSKYFGSAPVVYLEGRQHNVQIMNAKHPQDDYIFSCIVTVFQIHKEAPPNEDILVFLTGQEEIEAMTQSIRGVAKDLSNSYPPLKVYPLYSALQTSLQQQVFRPAPAGFRKVVVSTNVAETSVTIPGIKHVVDSGKVKAKAWQRTGRAGRESEGICYRVYTQAEFAQMARHTEPEILRCNLSTVALQLMALNINIMQFDFIDKPSKEALVSALKELKMLGAIDSTDSPALTHLGHQMAKFPIDPRYSKILLASKDFGCGEEILSIIAVMSGDTIFLTPLSKREEAKEAHSKYVSSAGDHVTMLQVFRNFKKVSQVTQWCHENFLHLRNLNYAVNVRKQLGQMCSSMGLVLSSCGQDMDKLRRCLVTGLFMNVAELQREQQYYTVGTRQKVSLHPSSVLAGTLPAYVLFSELLQTSKCYVRTLSIVDPAWLTELAPDYFRQHRLATNMASPSKNSISR